MQHVHLDTTPLAVDALSTAAALDVASQLLAPGLLFDAVDHLAQDFAGLHRALSASGDAHLVAARTPHNLRVFPGDTYADRGAAIRALHFDLRSLVVRHVSLLSGAAGSRGSDATDSCADVEGQSVPGESE